MIDDFKRAVEAEVAKRAHDALGRELHVTWTTWEEWPDEPRMVLCDGAGAYTSEGFELEDQVLPFTAYAEHIIGDTIGELGRRQWYIEPPPCSRCVAAADGHR